MSSTAIELLGGDRLGMGEVEAQPIGRDERALLRDVIAEHLAQRLVQQMGRRVIGADRGARGVVDLELERRRRRCSSPFSTSTSWTKRSPSFFLVSSDPDADAARRASTPMSPTWPPNSP